MPSLRANIGKLYALYALQSMLFHTPVIVLFLMERGLSLTEFFFVQSAASITMICCMVPAGYLADRFGRRNTIILSGVAVLCSIVILAWGRVFWHFVLSEIFRGIFRSLQFGAMNALTFDTLKALQEEERSRAVFGRQYALQFISLALASAIGGVVALHSKQLTVLMALPFMVLYFLGAFTLREPPMTIEHVSLAAIREASRKPNLRILLLFQALIGGLVFWLEFSSQPYLKETGLSLAVFGGMYALFQLAMAGGSMAVSVAGERVKSTTFLIAAACMIAVSTALLGIAGAIAGLVFLTLGIGAWGMLKASVMDLLNRMTASSTRATILSLQLFSIHICFAILGPMLGFLVESPGIGLHKTFLTAGLAALLIISILWVPLWRGRRGAEGMGLS